MSDEPGNDVIRFEIDQAVAGLGNYVDGKLLERYPANHPKENQLIYPTLSSVLALAKGAKPVNAVVKPKTKPKRKLTPPNIKRRKKR